MISRNRHNTKKFVIWPFRLDNILYEQAGVHDKFETLQKHYNYSSRAILRRIEHYNHISVTRATEEMILLSFNCYLEKVLTHFM